MKAESPRLRAGGALLPLLTGLLLGSAALPLGAQGRDSDLAAWIARSYEKRIARIPMRDGVHLHTVIYSPKDHSRQWPILMRRTPYSVSPYAPGVMPRSLGPSAVLARKQYIFVYQDVRGRFMSEGTFVNMTPHVASKRKKTDVDESSDTWDSLDWLVKNVPNNNGRAGLWGISYPGFYAAASMIDAHPSLKAVSPQAPIADWYFDDFHHHGALFLPHSFGFLGVFGRPQKRPTTEWGPRPTYWTPDGYEFFMDLGPLSNVNDRYFKNEVAFWNHMVEHPDYDAFWQRRNILPHLSKVAPAVMTVGGWFDAEDLYGPLKIYRSIEAKNPGIFNMLVMGPWRHGGWARDDGSGLGQVKFRGKPSFFYRETIEARFFEHHLKDAPDPDLPEAYVYETGAGRWRTFGKWPPARSQQRRMYFHARGLLSFQAPREEGPAYDEFVSDPARPVPYTEAITTRMTREYMTDDQRFAARRPDVLVWQTAPLAEDLTLVGPLHAELRVSTSESAADWVVKLIDVLPPDAPDHDALRKWHRMGSYQMMVRSEVIRGRYRNGYSKPEPFVPGQPTRVPLELQDVCHTFKKGHRVMIQVQSTWFPLVDRNPQRYVPNVFKAKAADFVKATHRVYRSLKLASHVRVGVLPAAKEGR